MGDSKEGELQDSKAVCDKNDEGTSCKDELSFGETKNQNSENMKDGEPVLSKRKQKRLAKHQQWLERKEQKKIAKKEKKRKAKEQGAPFPSRSSRRKKQKTMDCDEALPVKIAIDMAFDEFMDESSIKKLLKQVKWCYAANRKATNPVQLYLTSFGGRNKSVMEDVYHEYKSWDFSGNVDSNNPTSRTLLQAAVIKAISSFNTATYILETLQKLKENIRIVLPAPPVMIHIKTEKYLDMFEKNEIVYLSSDSENVLEEIDMSKIYIIGGLVDHNHHKGLCHKLAVENQVSHAQLPINDFVKLQSRTVLTVNHVFEILLKFLETRDWQTAFYNVIPKRKGVSLLNTEHEENETNCVEDDGKTQRSKGAGYE